MDNLTVFYAVKETSAEMFYGAMKMANRHIKVINGRKYYYESIRVGKKVTSRYLGPVERIRKKKTLRVAEEMQAQPAEVQPEQESVEQHEGKEEENYIG